MTFDIADVKLFKDKALQWAASFNIACCLDSNHFSDKYTKFDMLLAVGVLDEITAQSGNAFAALTAFRQRNPGWITGFLGYDLKNETENLTSLNADNLHFPDMYFFAPEQLIIINGNQVEIIADDPLAIRRQIEQIHLIKDQPACKLNIQPRLTKEDYCTAFEKIKLHIARGDIYVTNFCQEFFAEQADINPLLVYNALNQISPNPFSCFFKYHQQYILCASPERFLAKRGSKLISQPIKGTARRGASIDEDEKIKSNLRQSIKEQQENVMIVDLVRNDLTRSAASGSVQTEELFGIYSFEQVHQMISTVTCQLQEDLRLTDAIKNSFPMGSMTGAPKLRAMQLIEEYEQSRRGIYSGAIGYIDPNDDFDFNVVIRSVLYNAPQKYLSFQVGSAITFDAVAEQEYAECLLKAKPILQVLS